MGFGSVRVYDSATVSESRIQRATTFTPAHQGTKDVGGLYGLGHRGIVRAEWASSIRLQKAWYAFITEIKL